MIGTVSVEKIHPLMHQKHPMKEFFQKQQKLGGVANTAQKRRRLQNDPYSLLAVFHSLC